MAINCLIPHEAGMTMPEAMICCLIVSATSMWSWFCIVVSFRFLVSKGNLTRHKTLVNKKVQVIALLFLREKTGYKEVTPRFRGAFW
jgi:hypothetical protein